MHYVSALGLTKSFGDTPLFHKISFHISEGNKIALVARNGTGKSTLMKILAGLDTPEDGNIQIHKEVKVVFLSQEPTFEEDKTISENIFHPKSSEVNPVLQAIKNYELALEQNDGDAMAAAIIQMDQLSAWDFESKVHQILATFKVHHLQNKMNSLSGGQRKRVALAKTLINIGFDPGHHLLLMDEPTNHLDVEMIEWLEHFLNKEKMTLLLVTHDRYFLDNVCTEIWEMEKEKIFVYKGDYENYLYQKAARIENETSQIDKAKNNYRKELEWMRRQPKARTTKSRSREENFYEIESKAKQKIEDNRIQLNARMSRIGGKIIEMKKVYMQFGETVILKGFDYTFNKGERIGIIGKNGVGKSTFLEIVQQRIKPVSGKINIGETIVFGNFSQQGLEIKENMRVIEYVKSFAESFPLANGGSLSAAQFLELFLFTPEKQYTFLESLSGGEKKRLQLLAILFNNPNFLILDEPTNDLDLPTLSVLENFLFEFKGCLLIVSHDRYFMDRLIDHLFVFEGDGIVRDFPGNYAQYRIWLADQEKLKNEIAINKTESTHQKVEKPLKNGLNFNERKELAKIEKEITRLEEKKGMLEIEMSDAANDYEKLLKLTETFNQLKQILEEKELLWLELSEK
ncbi:MAG: ABC-F family ATP-binding cassette domain-containing protein [Bacteroidetes bacterium]|nr:ABC-F family ATP-binding cassette domain-containing protein [Bacteroidota bacterium]